MGNVQAVEEMVKIKLIILFIYINNSREYYKKPKPTKNKKKLYDKVTGQNA